MRDDWLAAMVSVIDMHRTSYPRFAQQPFRFHEPMPWSGRSKRRNPKRKAQAAAKRARKITRRFRP